MPVTANGSTGWVAVDLITEGSAPTAAAPVAAPADANTPFDATAMTDLNLRAAPDPSSAVLATVPAGSAIRTTGGPQNGYFPVEHAGQIGWVDGTALSITGGETTAVTPPSVAVTTPVPAPLPDPVTATGETAPAEAERRARGESTGIVWPFAGGRMGGGAGLQQRHPHQPQRFRPVQVLPRLGPGRRRHRRATGLRPGLRARCAGSTAAAAAC